jgi:hypothetical protein
MAVPARRGPLARSNRLSALARSDGLARLSALARDNRLFALVLGAGALLRLLAVVGYPGTLWFVGDSFLYLGAALRPVPDASKTVGYSFFLRALEPFHSLLLVAALQHLMGLAIGAGIYVLLRRAGVARPWAALAAAPVLLDGNEIELEHMMMAETLFTFLVMASVALLLWRPRPSWPVCLLAGLLAGYAVIVRTEGVPIPVVLAGYLLVRRMGWRPLLAIVAGCVAPVAGYVFWFHSSTGQYALTSSEGFYLWGAVSPFAQCAQLKPPADERRFCLSTPPARRLPPGAIIWQAPQVRHLPGGPATPRADRLLTNFAARAILAQPADYLRTVAGDVGRAVDWRRPAYPSAGTVYYYRFHLTPEWIPDRIWIPGGTSLSDIRAYGRASPSRVIKPVAALMADYQGIFYTWGPLLGAILLAGFGGLIRFWRRLGGDGLLPWVTAVVLLVVPMALAGFDYRYLIPVLPFSCLAAGLAAAPRRSGAATGPAESAGLKTGPQETGPQETGPQETGPQETGPQETGPPDAGPLDAAPQGEAIRFS